MDQLLLVLAVLLQAGDFAMNKLYQQRCGTSIQAGLTFNMLLGLFSALLFWVAGGFRLELSWYSALMAAAFSAALMLYNLIGFRIMRIGSMALYTLFLMTGGMLLPFVCGLLFWNEPFSWLRIAGLVLILAATVLSGTGKAKPDAKTLLLCAAVFILNGCTSIFSKLHQMETGQLTVSAGQFVVYTALAKALMAGIALLFTKGEKQKSGSFSPVLFIFLSALFSGVSYFCQLLGQRNLPATVLFPFITGGIMVCSTLSGMLFFKDRPSRAVLAGVALSFIGTLFFL